MSVFSRRSPPAEDDTTQRLVLEKKLNSIRPDGSTDEPIAPEDVTGLLELARERLRAAVEHTDLVLTRSTERLQRETEALREFSERLSKRPPP
jgi:hypothetical protein